MIGDLLSNAATAQKLSIEQIQQAIKDGTLPSYIGMPLLQQKMQERTEAAQLLAGKQQQGQLPIGEQVMQQADAITRPQPIQQAPQGQLQQPAPEPAPGIAAAQSNLPQQYAGGGIIAFANGGDVARFETGGATSGWDRLVASLGGQTADQYLQGVKNQQNFEEVQRHQPGFFDKTTQSERDMYAKSLNDALAARSGNAATAAANTQPSPQDWNQFDKATQDFLLTQKPQIGSRSNGPSAPAMPAGPTMPNYTQQDTGGINALVDKFSNMISANAEDPQKAKDHATGLALLEAAGKMASGTSPYALANIGPGVTAGAQSYGQGIKDIQANKDKQIAQLMQLGLTGQQLTMEAQKLGISQAELEAKIPLLRAQANYYNAKGAGAGIAGIPKGNVPAAQSMQLYQEYQGYLTNPQSAPFFKQLPKDAQTALTKTDPGSKSYQNSMRLFEEKARAHRDNQAEYIKENSAKFPVMPYGTMPE